LTPLENFTQDFRLKLTKDASGDPVVQGRLHRDAVISEFDQTFLALCFLVDGRRGAPSRTGMFNNVKRACLAAGMRIRQRGDQEAVFLFDPADRMQGKLAVKSIKARVKKVVGPEVRERLIAGLAKAREAKQPSVGQSAPG